MVPGGLGAFFLSLCVFGLVMSLSAGIKMTPSPVHLACMIIMALFLGLVGLSFLKVAVNGFVKEVVLTDDVITVKRVTKSDKYLWSELKRVASTNTGLNLQMLSGAEVDLGPSLGGFDDLVATVKAKYNEMKGIRGVPPEHQ